MFQENFHSIYLVYKIFLKEALADSRDRITDMVLNLGINEIKCENMDKVKNNQ